MNKPSSPKILVFAGSTRKESFNKKIAKIAMQGAIDAGVQTDYIDLKDFDMPLYDGDLENEKGLPENAKRLKKLFIEYDAFLIANPEYNSAISGVLKNAIDWVSRQETPQEESLIAFKNKYALIISASISAWGGIRSLAVTRNILENIGVTVLAQTKSLPKAHEAFDAQGKLDERTTNGFKETGAALAQFLLKLKG